MELTAESFMRACRERGRLIEQWLHAFDRQHGAALYREAASVLRSWAAAEDVVQEALIKVWQRCAGYRGDGSPAGWVRQILRRALLDHLRARRPEAALQDEEGELMPEVAQAVERLSADQGDPALAQLHAQQAQAVFRHCFERFGQAHPEHATVLRWVVEDGLDNAAIERLLGRSPGATREFISQCRKKARPFLAPWYALVSAGGD